MKVSRVGVHALTYVHLSKGVLVEVTPHLLQVFMARRDVRRRRAPRCFPTVSVLLFLLCFRPILAGSAPTLARSPPIPTLARSPPIPDLAEERSSESEVHETPGGFEVVGLHWKHVKEPYFIAVWILVASLAKLLFHLSHRLSAVIPESCLLIVLGLLLGGVVWGAIHQAEFTLTPTVFFFYLLPPIVFDAGYFMPSRLFFDNLGAILTYAVFGTVWNAATTGLSLYGVYCLGSMGPLNVTVLDFLLFGSLIAAVDPVAVLAVFEEVHVNEVLFIIVFGESLLNDAVTVVLYKVFDSFAGVGITNIQTLDYVKGIGSFFVVALGGTAVGVVFAFFMSLVTRFTKHVKIMEPAFILTLAYLSYLTAEMFSLSSILAITFCGICCRRYVEANVDAKSQTTVWYTLKLLASSAETIIFIFLGISAIDTEKWTWNTSFILLTLLFISVFRIIGVVLQTWLLNIGRVVPLNYIDQAVMSYGGLRGAVAFALVALLDEEKVPEKRLFLSTTIIVVFFTIVIQGLTIKPLVKFLKVKLSEEHQPTLSEEMYLRVFDHTLTAVEDIVGQIGHHYVRDKWEYFDRNYLSKVLMRPMARMNKSNLWDLYHDLNVKDAISFVQQKEKSGSLAFVHSPGDKASNINFTALAPSDTELSLSNMLRKSDTNVLLDMQAVDVVQRCPNDSEDIIVHRMLSNSLYQTYRRRQPRYSRHMMKNDLQHKEEREIFKRNMLNRLQSFKSSKQGKHIRGKRRHKVSVNGHSGNGDLGNCSWSDKYNGVCKSDVIVEEEEDENGITFIAMGPSNAHEEGFTNLTFKPDDTTYRLPPPWLLVENSTPPVNAQPELPQPSWPFSRLIPLRGSRRSNDSLVMVDNSTFKVPSRASSPERSTRCCTLSPQRSQSPPPMQSSPRRVLTSPQGEDESVRDQGESANTPRSSDSSATVSKSTHDLPETKF